MFVEPIAHTAAECRGYNRAVARVGMTGLGRPAVGGVLRAVVGILNAALFLRSRIRGPRVATGGFVCLWSRLPSRQRSAVATSAR